MQPKIIEKDACKQLGMSQRKLREWRNANGIKGTKIGRSYYYDQRDLEMLWKFLKGKNTNAILRELQQIKNECSAKHSKDVHFPK